MRYLPAKVIIILALAVTLINGTVTLALAQAKSMDLDYVYDIQDPQAVDGDIVITSGSSGLVRAKTAYDPNLFGIIETNPLVVYKRVDNTGLAVSRNGVAEVNVTDLNGAIKAGDYITSSTIDGKGQKAITSGYVIGIALDPLNLADAQTISYTPPNTTATQQVHSGKISIAVRIEYAELTNTRSFSRLLDSFNVAFASDTQNPERAIQLTKYIVSGLTVLISIIIAFFAFSRAIPKGIEAMGRNPLAERAILASIILNILFTIVTISLGVVAALVIIKS